MSKQVEAFSSSRGQQQSGQRAVVGGKQQGAGQQSVQRAVVGGKQQGVTKKDANPRGPKSLEALGADYLRVCASIPGCKPDGAFAETFKTGRIDIALDALGAPELAAIGKSLIALHGLTAISMTVGAEDKRVRRVGPKKEVLINSSVSAANAFFAGLVRTISCSPGLLELRLDGVVLGGVSLTRLARAIEPLERLGSLSLARCGLGDRGLAVLADSLGRSHSVYCLGLRACELGPASGAPLASVFKRHSLYRDEIKWACGLRSDPADPCVMGALYVDVSENALGDEGAAAVARELTNDAWLKALRLDSNGITSGGAAALLEALDSNEALRVLCLRGNDESAEPARAAVEARLAQRCFPSRERRPKLWEAAEAWGWGHYKQRTRKVRRVKRRRGAASAAAASAAPSPALLPSGGGGGGGAGASREEPEEEVGAAAFELGSRPASSAGAPPGARGAAAGARAVGSGGGGGSIVSGGGASSSRGSDALAAYKAVRAAEFDSHDAETREQLLRVALDEVEAQWVAERRGAAEERGRCEAFEARLLLAEAQIGSFGGPPAPARAAWGEDAASGAAGGRSSAAAAEARHTSPRFSSGGRSSEDDAMLLRGDEHVSPLRSGSRDDADDDDDDFTARQQHGGGGGGGATFGAYIPPHVLDTLEDTVKRLASRVKRVELEQRQGGGASSAPRRPRRSGQV